MVVGTATGTVGGGADVIGGTHIKGQHLCWGSVDGHWADSSFRKLWAPGMSQMGQEKYCSQWFLFFMGCDLQLIITGIFLSSRQSAKGELRTFGESAKGSSGGHCSRWVREEVGGWAPACAQIALTPWPSSCPAWVEGQEWKGVTEFQSRWCLPPPCDKTSRQPEP